MFFLKVVVRTHQDEVTPQTNLRFLYAFIHNRSHVIYTTATSTEQQYR